MLYPSEVPESSAAVYKEVEIDDEQHWAQSTLPEHLHLSETEKKRKTGPHTMRTNFEAFISPFSTGKKGDDSLYNSNGGVTMKNFKKEIRRSSEGRDSMGGVMEADPLGGYYEVKNGSFFPKREVNDYRIGEANRSIATEYAAVDYPSSGSVLPSHVFRTPFRSPTHSQSPPSPLYTRRSGVDPIVEPTSVLLPSSHAKQSDAYPFLLRPQEEKKSEAQRLYEENKRLQYHIRMDRQYFAQYGRLFFVAQEAGMRRELQLEEKKIRAEIQIQLYQSIISFMGVVLQKSHDARCSQTRVEPSPDCCNPNLPSTSAVLFSSHNHLAGEERSRRVESVQKEHSVDNTISFHPDGLHGVHRLHKPSLGSPTSYNGQESATVALHSRCLSSLNTVPTPIANTVSPFYPSVVGTTGACFSSSSRREELLEGLPSSPSFSHRDEMDFSGSGVYEDGVTSVGKKGTRFSSHCFPLTTSSFSSSERPLNSSVPHSVTSALADTSCTSMHQGPMQKNVVPISSSPLNDTCSSYHSEVLSHSHRNYSDSNREKGKVSELTSTVKVLEERIHRLSTALSNEAKLTKDMQEEIDDLILQELVLVEESERANIEATYAETFLGVIQEEKKKQ